MSEPAAEIRRKWLEAMGLPEDEIEETIISCPPVDADEEREQLAAVREMQVAEIRKLPIRCPGGQWCTCCYVNCTCGCRDECSVFLAAGRRYLKERMKHGPVDTSQKSQRNGLGE